MSKESSDKPPLIEAKGCIKNNTARERSFFTAFKQFFIPRLKKQEELGLAFEEAKVKKTDAEGEKMIQEAAKIAAEKDLVRQQEMKAFFENLDSILASGESEMVTKLKLAKLMSEHPQLAEQLEKVNMLIENLADNKSCYVTIDDD